MKNNIEGIHSRYLLVNLIDSRKFSVGASECHTEYARM